MLRRSQIPAPDVLKKLNKRLREWLKTRDNVTLFPLAEQVAAMKVEGRVVQLDPAAPAVRLGPELLMQSDLLHPSKLGVVVVAQDIASRVMPTLPADHPLRVGVPNLLTVAERLDLDGDLTDAVESAQAKAKAQPVPAGAKK